MPTSPKALKPTYNQQKWLERFGFAARTWREHHGFTQGELARRAGVAQITISRIEAGEPSMSLLLLHQVYGGALAALIAQAE